MASPLSALFRALGRVLVPIGVVALLAGAAAGYLGARKLAAPTGEGVRRIE